MRTPGTRHALATAFLSTLLWGASPASAGEAMVVTDAPEAAVAPAPVLTAEGIDRRALQLNLAQTLGPDSQRDLHRYRQDVFGTPVQIGVSHGAALAGPAFTPAGAQDSATFQRGAVTGNVGLLNVAWAGLQRLGSDAAAPRN